MNTTEMVAGLREYASAVAGADEIAGVPVEELADNHMQIRARYIDANGWIETHASAIADEMERLRAEVERMNRVESAIACATDCLNTWCRENSVAECKDYAKDFSLRDTIDGLVDRINSERNRLRAEVERMREAASDILRTSFEASAYVGENPKSRSDWDEYDEMMAPLWIALADAKGGE